MNSAAGTSAAAWPATSVPVAPLCVAALQLPHGLRSLRSGRPPHRRAHQRGVLLSVRPGCCGYCLVLLPGHGEEGASGKHLRLSLGAHPAHVPLTELQRRYVTTSKPSCQHRIAEYLRGPHISGHISSGRCTAHDGVCCRTFVTPTHAKAPLGLFTSPVSFD